MAFSINSIKKWIVGGTPAPNFAALTTGIAPLPKFPPPAMSPASLRDEAGPDLAAERAAIQTIQRAAMDAAFAAAQNSSPQRDYWNMSDYLNAVGSDAIQKQWQAAYDNGQLNQAFDNNALKAMLNFDGMQIENFALERETIPSAYQNTKEREALKKAWQNSDNDGIQNLLAIIEGEDFLYNLNGDMAINALYETVETALNLKQTTLIHCITHPAGTYDEVAQGANCKDMIFRGIEAGETIDLRGGGTFTNIRFEETKGGTVSIHAKVQGLDLSGAHIQLELGQNGRVDGFSVSENTRILDLRGTEGAILKNGRFGAHNITMASNIEGMKLENITFEGSSLHGMETGNSHLKLVHMKAGPDGQKANLNHADFQGTHIERSIIEDTSLKNTRFAGATLTNVTFRNIDAEDLKLQGAILRGRLEIQTKNPEKLDLTDVKIPENTLFVNNTTIHSPADLQKLQTTLNAPSHPQAATAEASPQNSADAALKAALAKKMAELDVTTAFNFTTEPNAQRPNTQLAFPQRGGRGMA